MAEGCTYTEAVAKACFGVEDQYRSSHIRWLGNPDELPAEVAEMVKTEGGDVALAVLKETGRVTLRVRCTPANTP